MDKRDQALAEIDRVFIDVTEEVENSKMIPKELFNRAELWNTNA